MDSNIKNAKTIMEAILLQISNDFNIDKVSLLKYLETDKDLQQITFIKKTPGTIICRARKQDGLRCTRRCKDESDFCGKHIKQQKYGCVQDSIKPDLINTTELYYNDTKYLIDDDNIIYQQQDEQYEIVGKRMKNGKISFLKELIERNLLTDTTNPIDTMFNQPIQLPSNNFNQYNLSEIKC